MCKNSIQTEENEASCFETDTVGAQYCCAEEDILEDEKVCCAESEIKEMLCSDYAADGYTCATQCFDRPQDIPIFPISTMKPFLPKEAKCPRGHICCKRTEPIDTPTLDPEVSCEESGNLCLDFDNCDPDTIKSKPASTLDTADLLFAEDNFIEPNFAGGLTINNAKNVCENPTKVCCQPLKRGGGPDPVPEPIPEPSIPETSSCPDQDLTECLFGGPCKCVDVLNPPPPPEGTTKYLDCGKRNRHGLKRGGVSVAFTHANGKPVTSQEGEWPHTCLILKIEEDGVGERLVGGASLIAPKVIITAAHIVG